MRRRTAQQGSLKLKVNEWVPSVLDGICKQIMNALKGAQRHVRMWKYWKRITQRFSIVPEEFTLRGKFGVRRHQELQRFSTPGTKHSVFIPEVLSLANSVSLYFLLAKFTYFSAPYAQNRRQERIARLKIRDLFYSATNLKPCCPSKENCNKPVHAPCIHNDASDKNYQH